MGRKPYIINLTAEGREYLETQTRARTIQTQTVNRSRILLLKADGCSIDDVADKVGGNPQERHALPKKRRQFGKCFV